MVRLPSARMPKNFGPFQRVPVIARATPERLEKVLPFQRAVCRRRAELRPGTVLAREWNGHMQRVAVLADGFAWNGKTFPSLSGVALAITGTRWNGPKFFGMRDKPSRGTW